MPKTSTKRQIKVLLGALAEEYNIGLINPDQYLERAKEIMNYAKESDQPDTGGSESGVRSNKRAAS